MATSNQINTNFSVEDSILKRSTLLYLEDDETIGQETFSIFEKVFGKVYFGKDGQEGIDLYNNHKNEIDIILTDINMPNVNGLEFMSEVRKLDFEIPVLIITAFNDVNILSRAIKLNVTDYIVKPMQLNSTLKILNKILTNRHNQKLVDKQQKELQIYKDIIDNENLVSETDLKGYITYANDIFCKVSGYTKEELIGANHNIVRHPDVSPKVYENLWETIQQGNIWRGKIKNKTKDGSYYYVKSTIFPILDEDGNIEKYVSSRYVITEEEEEKHKLKKFIMKQKSDQIKHAKQMKEDFDDAVHFAKMQKDEQVAKFIHELNEQIKSLRTKNADNKGRIISLENKLKEALDKNDDLQKGYQIRIEKLHKTSVLAVENYQKIKKRSDIISEKYEKAQEGIKTFQGYIDEYREKIKNLEDVIAAYEDKFGQLGRLK